MKYALPLMILLTFNFIGSAGATQTREATIYRCGKDGTELRDSPCPEAPAKAGSAVLYDQPEAQDLRAASARAKADARQAQAMEKERLAEEARARRETARAGNLGPAPALPASAPKAAHAKPPKPAKPRHAPRAASAPRP